MRHCRGNPPQRPRATELPSIPEIGMRLQMWHAAWILFKERPVLGIGRESYPAGVKRLAAQGIISPAAAHFAHSHNELLFNLAIGGIVGMLAILGLYFVPAYYSSRAVHHPDQQVRTTAAMGITLSVCFLIFGMTDLMFFWTAIGSFYTMCTALFFACLVRRREETREGTAMAG
jgi:O-antigen ligase